MTETVHDAFSGREIDIEIDRDGDVHFSYGWQPDDLYIRPDDLLAALDRLGLRMPERSDRPDPSGNVRAAWRAHAALDDTERRELERHRIVARNRRRRAHEADRAALAGKLRAFADTVRPVEPGEQYRDKDGDVWRVGRDRLLYLYRMRSTGLTPSETWRNDRRTYAAVADTYGPLTPVVNMSEALARAMRNLPTAPTRWSDHV